MTFLLSKKLPLLLTAAVAVPLTGVAAPEAHAAPPMTHKCSLAANHKVGGLDVSSLSFTTKCTNAYRANVISGTAFLTDNYVAISYSQAATTPAVMRKGGLHEHAHFMEYHTPAAYRKKLYKYLGINLSGASSNYFEISDAYYKSGTLKDWKKSPRERLAESVVNCVYGSPNHSGMKLVPAARCASFMATAKAAARASRDSIRP